MPPVTLSLIIANVAVFLLESAGTLSPEGMLALWPPVSGPFGSNFELWQLITYSFLHGHTAHIFFNMFALYICGVLLAYGLYFPHRQVMLLIPPIPMSARTLVVVYAVLELVLGVTGTAAGGARFAALRGMLGGYLMIRYRRGFRN